VRGLVVEDDGVAGAVVEALAAHGHVAVRAARAVDVWARVRGSDVVLLDLGLPDGDGLEVLRRLRRITDTPVLVLTARDGERDVVRGLHLGADDYLVKPVRPRELLARVEAVTRRVRLHAAAGGPDVVEVGDLRVDLDARRAVVAGPDVGLTATGSDVLAVLARRAGAAVSRQQILDGVWGDAYLAVSRALDVHVAALRGKLARPGLLTTVRGFGYRLGG